MTLSPCEDESDSLDYDLEGQKRMLTSFTVSAFNFQVRLNFDFSICSFYLDFLSQYKTAYFLGLQILGRIRYTGNLVTAQAVVLYHVY